jgi:uncharacterized protein YpmB
MDGLGTYVDRDTAIAMAKRDTPLRWVESVEGSSALPFRHMITGRDQTQRRIVVWVKTSVSQSVYVDELITPARALAVAEATGFKPGVEPKTVLGHLMGQKQDVYWRVSNGSQSVVIDAKTGEVIRDRPGA